MQRVYLKGYSTHIQANGGDYVSPMKFPSKENNQGKRNLLLQENLWPN